MTTPILSPTSSTILPLSRMISRDGGEVEERRKCLFCYGTVHDLFSENKSIPANGGATSCSEETDVCIPYNVQFCESCQSAQTKYLAPLPTVYSVSHNQLVGSLWEEHHTEFSRFVSSYFPSSSSSSPSSSILEIGVSNFGIATKIHQSLPEIPYTCMDINLPSIDTRPSWSSYVSGQFETTPPSQDYTVMVMSHIFEHFYDPRRIVEIISLYPNVKDLFISLPDLRSYLKQFILNVLNVEHTYYVDTPLLKGLFSRYGFTLEQVKSFKDHSIFYHFKRQPSLPTKTETMNMISSVTKPDFLVYFDVIRRNVSRMNRWLSMGHSIYLFPCHFFVHYLTMFGLRSHKLKGVVDNNPSKWGKRLYGTSLTCFPVQKGMETGAGYILAGGCYNSEIKTWLSSQKSSVPVMEFLPQSKRIALCLNGQPRFYQRGFEMYMRTLFSSYLIDVFYHTWWDASKVGTPFQVAPWSEIRQPISMEHHTDQWLQDHYNPCGVEYESPREFVSESISPVKYPKSSSLVTPNNMFSKCWSQYRSVARMNEEEKKTQMKYDTVIISRFDMFFPYGLGMDLTSSSMDFQWVYNPKDNLHDKGYHVADHIMICNSEDANIIAEIYHHIDTCYQECGMMNAEEIFTHYFKRTGLYNRFKKYDIPYLDFFRTNE